MYSDCYYTLDFSLNSYHNVFVSCLSIPARPGVDAWSVTSITCGGYMFISHHLLWEFCALASEIAWYVT